MINQPAHYIHGTTKIVEVFHVKTEGGIFVVGELNFPLDDLSIEVLPGTFSKPVDISIGLNNGQLKVNSGVASNVTIAIQISDNKIKFNFPLKITIIRKLDKQLSSILGYAIEESGQIEPVDTIINPEQPNKVSFYTFKPIMLTWIIF